MNFHKFFLIFFSSIFLFFTNNIFAFSIEPMFLDMKPVGNQSRAIITVANTSPRPMPVRASVSEIILNENGVANSRPDNASFLIFPPQAVIRPHSKQTFRVQWRGQPNLPKGKTYEINIGQILAQDNRPNNQGKETSIKLRLAMAFGSIISMSATTGEPRPTVNFSRLSKNRSGKNVIDTVINNNSNQNFMMIQADSTVTLFNAANQRLWSYTYAPDDMMRNFGLGMVQPHKSRRMQIPLPNLPDHIARQAKSAKLEIRPSAQ